MQEEFYPFTVDPKLLDLNKYPACPSITDNVFGTTNDDVDDDIAISSGQIDLDGGDNGLGVDGPSGSDGDIDLYSDLTLRGTFDFKYFSLNAPSPHTSLTRYVVGPRLPALHQGSGI